MLPFPGVIAIVERFAAFTVKGALPLTVPRVAEIFVLPMFNPVASPLTVIEAMLVTDDLQVTTPVTSCTLLSEKVPVAVNCCAIPSGMLGFAGVTAIDVMTAEVTVRVVDPEIEPRVAEMVVLPAATAVASPWVGPLVTIVAAAAFDEFQVTLPVRFCVVVSL
jgi:hypothetical protein